MYIININSPTMLFVDFTPEKRSSENRNIKFDFKLWLLRFKVEATRKIDVDKVKDSLRRWKSLTRITWEYESEINAKK